MQVTEQKDFKVESAMFDGGNIFMAWPVEILHKIDHASPLKIIKKDSKDYEIVVILDGVNKSTGKSLHITIIFDEITIILYLNYNYLI